LQKKKGVIMADLLIRDVSDDVVARLDAKATRLGLSRSEYLRRRLAEDAQAEAGGVTLDDLRRTATVFADLADPEVMGRAWRHEAG
jgi:Ribbon-helix-helix protein, copG family